MVQHTAMCLSSDALLQSVPCQASRRCPLPQVIAPDVHICIWRCALIASMPIYARPVPSPCADNVFLLWQLTLPSLLQLLLPLTLPPTTLLQTCCCDLLHHCRHLSAAVSPVLQRVCRAVPLCWWCLQLHQPHAGGAGSMAHSHNACAGEKTWPPPLHLTLLVPTA